MIPNVSGSVLCQLSYKPPLKATGEPKCHTPQDVGPGVTAYLGNLEDSRQRFEHQ